MTDKMREAFEKWATDKGYNIERWIYGRHLYANRLTQNAWEVWQAAQSPALTELAAEYEQRITDLEDVLRSLACSLSAGGYNADTVDSTVFEKKIRDGIDMLIAPLRERIRQLEALMVPGGFPSDVITAAGLVYHGKRDKVLAERLRIGAQSMLAAAIAGEGEKK